MNGLYWLALGLTLFLLAYLLHALFNAEDVA